MSNVLFQWDPIKYTVKVNEMDDEHKEIIRLMNILFEKSEQKKPRNEILAAMKALASYTIKHFEDEEKYFTTLTNYTGAAIHKKIHQDLLKRVTEFISQYEKSNDVQVSPAFFNFLKVWLSAHIAGVDRKYGEASNSKVA